MRDRKLFVSFIIEQKWKINKKKKKKKKVPSESHMYCIEITKC